MEYYDLNKEEVFYIRHDNCVKAAKYIGTIYNHNLIEKHHRCILKVAGEKDNMEIYFPNVKLYPTIDDCRKGTNMIPCERIKLSDICRHLGLDVIEDAFDCHSSIRLYKWDGYYPVRGTKEVINFPYSFDGEWSIDLNGYYKTFEECEKDNCLKIITFGDEEIHD